MLYFWYTGGKKIGATIIVLIVLVVGYFLAQGSAPEGGEDVIANKDATFLSEDSKSIIADGEVVLDVGDKRIFTWFQNDTWCGSDEYEYSPDTSNPFCEDILFFRDQTKFYSIVVSPDATKIGFTLETDEILGDRVAGIFSRTTDEINFLTHYYLGNEFISFSPSGIYFVYRNSCFEGRCNHTIRNSETLTEEIVLPDARFPDETEFPEEKSGTVFSRWLSDTEVEYWTGTPFGVSTNQREIMRVSF